MHAHWQLLSVVLSSSLPWLLYTEFTFREWNPMTTVMRHKLFLNPQQYKAFPPYLPNPASKRYRTLFLEEETKEIEVKQWQYNPSISPIQQSPISTDRALDWKVPLRGWVAPRQACMADFTEGRLQAQHSLSAWARKPSRWHADGCHTRRRNRQC